MDALVFSLAGLPRGQGRPRAAKRGSYISIYKDAASRKYEGSVAQVAKLAMGNYPPFHGALSVSLRFRMPIPKSAPKYARAAMAAGETAHIGKPDIDNLVKAMLDGLNSDPKDPKTPIVFGDDAQIVRLFATKIYADKPGVDVRVEPLAPQPEPTLTAPAAPRSARG